MSFEVSVLVRSRRIGDATARALLLEMADRADDKGRGVWASVGRLADWLEVSPRTVHRALRLLEGAALIRREGLRGDPGQQTVVWALDLPMIGQLAPKNDPSGTVRITADVDEPSITGGGDASGAGGVARRRPTTAKMSAPAKTAPVTKLHPCQFDTPVKSAPLTICPVGGVKMADNPIHEPIHISSLRSDMPDRVLTQDLTQDPGPAPGELFATPAAPPVARKAAKRKTKPIAPVEYPEGFVAIWEDYPRPGRVRSSKLKALEAWNRACARFGADRVDQGFRASLRELSKDDGAYAPALERWLTGRLESAIDMLDEGSRVARPAGAKSRFQAGQEVWDGALKIWRWPNGDPVDAGDHAPLPSRL